MSDGEPGGPSVDRCVCAGVTFAALLALSRTEGLDFDGLQRRTRCGAGCGLCIPYLREALRTGRARVPLRPSMEATNWVDWPSD